MPSTIAAGIAAAMTIATLTAAPAHAAPACQLLVEAASPTSSTAVSPALIAAVPGPVTGLSVTAADTTATLTWTPPHDTGDLPLTGYYLPLLVAGVIVAEYSAPAASTGCALTGLTAGTAYTVVVAARNIVGLGPAATLDFTPGVSNTAPSTPASGSSLLPPAVPQDPSLPDPYSAAPSTTPTVQRPARVRLSPPDHRSGHRLTLRWTARHTDTVRLTWRRGHGRPHSQLTTPSGRITLAGPPGTVYRVTAKAGTAVARKIYRIK